MDRTDSVTLLTYLQSQGLDFTIENGYLCCNPRENSYPSELNNLIAANMELIAKQLKKQMERKH